MERLARKAVALSADSTTLNDKCLARWDLAEVLASAGRIEEAEAALDDALECAARKQHLALARQVRERQVALQPV